MSNSTPAKNGLIPAVVQMMSAWLVNNGCNFMKFVERCFVPHVLPYGSDVYLRMSGLKSEGVVRQGCRSVLRAVVAALSARSLPGMPTWPGSQINPGKKYNVRVYIYDDILVNCQCDYRCVESPICKEDERTKRVDHACLTHWSVYI